jgi:hypothetical protein
MPTLNVAPLDIFSVVETYREDVDKQRWLVFLLRVAADAKDETDEDGVNAQVDEERELATMATVAIAAVLNFIVVGRDGQERRGSWLVSRQATFIALVESPCVGSVLAADGRLHVVQHR